MSLVEYKEKYPFIFDNSLPSPVDQNFPRPILYKIQKLGKTVGYIGGTCHATTRPSILDNDKIKKTFNKSTHIGLEIDVREEEFTREAKKALSSYILDSESQDLFETLQNILGSHTNEFYSLMCEFKSSIQKGEISYKEASIAILLDYLPAFIKTLSSLNYQQEDFLVTKAESSKKEILPLENMGSHCESYVNTTQKAFVDAFRQKELSLEAFQYLACANREIFAAWHEGNDEILNQLANEDTPDKEEIKQRNLTMANEIDSFLSQSEIKEIRASFWIGALHLYGKESVINYLKEKNWTLLKMDTNIPPPDPMIMQLYG